MDFDWYVLQPVQSISNIKLFSSFADAKTSPQLAKSWKSLNSDTEWEIEIRHDITFSGGRKVTTDDVVRSLQRVVFLSKEKKAKNGFIERLLGIDSLKSAYNKNFPGINIHNGNLKISFTRPTPNIQELLGFGLYAIVNSENFDANTGKWKSKFKEYKGAGPYYLFSEESGKVIFRLRDDYPKELYSSRPYTKIEFNFEPRKFFKSDLLVGTNDQKELEADHVFVSAGVTGISYIQIHPWKLKKSSLSGRGFRRRLQLAFEKNFEAYGFKPARSFFPKILTGVEDVVIENFGNEVIRETGKEISFIDFRPLSTALSNSAVNALEQAVKDVGFKPKSIKAATIEDKKISSNPNLNTYKFDIAFYETDISLIDPFQDIKLMFSKNGIDLPDETGEIRKEIEKETFSIQKVNQLLVNQSIIWPVAQRAQGIWASGDIDFSRYNSMLLLGELQWLGQK